MVYVIQLDGYSHKKQSRKLLQNAQRVQQRARDKPTKSRHSVTLFRRTIKISSTKQNELCRKFFCGQTYTATSDKKGSHKELKFINRQTLTFRRKLFTKKCGNFQVPMNIHAPEKTSTKPKKVETVLIRKPDTKGVEGCSQGGAKK